MGWQDELSPPLILMDTVKGVVGFSVVLWQHVPSQISLWDRMPDVSQAYYGSFSMDTPQVNFSFSGFYLPLKFYIGLMVFVFYFKVLM